MLKQLFSRIKKVQTILLAVLFVVSLTAAASNAEPDHDPQTMWGMPIDGITMGATNMGMETTTSLRLHKHLSLS